MVVVRRRYRLVKSPTGGAKSLFRQEPLLTVQLQPHRVDNRIVNNDGAAPPEGQIDRRDPVLEALGELAQAIRLNTERNKKMMRRIDYISRLRAGGYSYVEIVAREDRPLIVEMATENLDAMMEAGHRLRKAEAAALHEGGLTMDRIAELFGVTRQRISQLLACKGARNRAA